MSEPVLEARGLVKRFEEGPQVLEILHGIDMEVRRGEFVAIVGSSGSGKTTLLHLLSGLDTPSAGEVRICGQDFSRCKEAQRGELRNRHIGFVYQFHHLLPEFTALENVCMPLLLRKGSIAEAEARATRMLVRVGLGERLGHKPAELSGGERQRVALARALVTEPAVVLADEPTGNLDNDTSEDVQALLVELNRELGISFLIVTHDPSLAGKAHRILRMDHGRLADLSA
ncbi:MAG: lolD [Moraxellaceae bacterium]|jgi:lipoprotein-releasing system ATP-binding protein|nr:lolD [Moraxellaceae bacterium]